MRSVLSMRLSRWASDHPFETDVAFAAFVGAMTMLGFVAADVDGSERSPDAIGGLLILGQAASFAFRRRAPIASLLGVVAFTVTFWVADYASSFEAFSLLSVYAATAHGGDDRGRVWRVVGSVVAAVSVIAVIGVLSPSEDLPAAAVVGIAALHITAAIAGEIVYDRRKRVRELEQRAVRAEAERGLLARQAVLDERARIARDLHDVVAHGMSVMVVQAGADERLVHRHPDEAAEALGHIQQAGREALTEMRRMLDVLRSEPKGDRELAPQPTMDDLGQIVQHCSDSGIPTELIVDGERSMHSAGQEMAAYRVVQEALTNVIKHAGRPARAVVRVQFRPEHIHVEIIDDGTGTTDGELAAAAGHGLVGMRERVDLYDGTLRFGPRPGGRYGAVRPDAGKRFVMLRVAIVDDQELVRTGFAMILGSDDGLEVVGQAENGREAVELCRRLRPDVVLMDIRMPEMDGIEATRTLLADTDSTTRVLILTTFDLDDYVYDAIRAGASGFLLKDTPADDLIRAVKVVGDGDALLSPSVTRRLIEEFAAESTSYAPSAGIDQLTERETEVLALMARGRSNQEIAAELYLGETTIKTHVSRVLTKLGVRDRVQAVIAAYEAGLVRPGRDT